MFKFRLLSLLFIAFSAQAMEVTLEDREFGNGPPVLSAIKKTGEADNETPFKGFQEITPLTLTARKPKGYQLLCEKLENFPQFATAFVYDEKNNQVNIHLPHAIVMTILGNTLLNLECPSLAHKSRDLLSEIVFCSHSYQGPSVINAWNSNNEMTPNEIKWVSPAPKKFNALEEVFDYAFNKNDYKGLIFGESHNDFTCRYTLIGMLPTLVNDYGVKTLFVEQPLELQPLLDQYFRTEVNEMPPELASCLEYIDEMTAKFSQMYPVEKGYLAVIKAAKKAGIESVKAIDNLMEYYCDDKDILDRLVTMNQDFPIYYNPNVRSVAFCGLGHSTSSRFAEQKEKCVYGLREITGLPAINIFSSLIEPNYGERGIYFRESPKFQEPSGKYSQEKMAADFDFYFDLRK